MKQLVLTLMTTQEIFRSIVSEIHLFKDVEQKENFLFVLGALVSRVISLKKASEIMEIEPELFLKFLDLMGIKFSYLSQHDVALEKKW